MSYGADGPALFRLSAKFVHRILYQFYIRVS
jgi:hypothetical protein